MIYIITCLSTRHNPKHEIRPTLESNGRNDNISNDFLGVFTSKEQAVANIKKIAEHFENEWRNDVTSKMFTKGEYVTGRVYATANDEYGNEWTTQVFLDSFGDEDINKDVETSILYFQL